MRLNRPKIILIAALGLASILLIQLSKLSGATGKPDRSQAMATHRPPAAAPEQATEKPAAANEIVIGNYEFIPATLKVSVGTTVRWSNRDVEAHTVNSATDMFKSSPLDTDENFSFKFTTPGIYPYYCKLHPQMKGQVVVK